MFFDMAFVLPFSFPGSLSNRTFFLEIFFVPFSALLSAFKFWEMCAESSLHSSFICVTPNEHFAILEPENLWIDVLELCIIRGSKIVKSSVRSVFDVLSSRPTISQNQRLIIDGF